MFFRKKTKKKTERDLVFKKEAYIPKKRLEKKERTLPRATDKKRGAGVKAEKSVGRKILVAVLWTLFLGEVFYVLLFANFFPVASLEIQREEKAPGLPEETVRKHLEASWQGKWLYVVPKNNLVLIRPQEQARRLQERFPRFQRVTVRRSWPEKLVVSIEEKPFQVLWCRQNDCFLVDEERKARSAEVFFQYPEEQGKVVRIDDEAPEPVREGVEVLAPEDALFLTELVTEFPLRTGLEFEGNFERPNLYAREMRVRSNRGFTLFFNTRLPVSESLNNLMLVLEKEIPEGEWEKVDYIDLRAENRVYYTREDRAPEKTEEQKKREEEEQKKEEERKKQEEQSSN